jgi:general secretion pathway protein D/MSHA biogenesis protein MshL
MKCTTRSLTCFLAALGILLLCSCVHNDTQTETPEPTTEDLIAQATADPTPPAPTQLPVRYQNPAFVTADDTKVDDELGEDQEYAVKVGANIRSTRGPQPLWDILKRLAGLKGMSVSWSSDVQQDVMVDVDISANDDYYEAIDNLLRQVDYFHEIQGQTIVVKYKETKTYHIAMPFTHQVYETATGGNILGSSEEASSIEGTIRLDSRENEFDIWKNIQENMDSIIATWSTTTTTTTETMAAPQAPVDGEPAAVQATRQTSTGGNTYTIDKPVGLITVQAPRPLQQKIESYLDGIEKELYKQIAIEAKIVEVQLNDFSSLGINWNTLLDSLSFGGNMGLTKSYDKLTTDNITNSFGNDTSFSRTKTNTLENKSSRSNELTNTEDNKLTSDFTNGSTTSGVDGTVTNDDGVLHHVGDAVTSYLAESKSGNSSSDSTTDTTTNVLSSATSALTTAATIITNGASNSATGLLQLATFNFNDFIHALSQQGATTILANPKLSVMNGQPALITAGRNVTYIDSIESDVTSGTTVTTNYTVNTERILSGVGLSLTAVINNDNEIILNLVPVTSVLQEPIEYRDVGLGQVGLPVVNIREMSTMVKVQDGEMLVIGGLISTAEQTKGQNLFPGLADVPVLKYLTGYEEKTKVKRELIILLRPRIL